MYLEAQKKKKKKENADLGELNLIHNQSWKKRIGHISLTVLYMSAG